MCSMNEMSACISYHGKELCGQLGLEQFWRSQTKAKTECLYSLYDCES